MTTYLVLTAIGDDKPGLVGALSEAIAAHGGNWLESSMSQLAGKFAGILRVSVSDEQADALIAALQNTTSGLKLVIERVELEQISEAPMTVRLSLVGNDRPGIIREISNALAGLGVNVEKLTTECVPAPMSSEILFKANAILLVPPTVETDRMRQSLEQLTDDLIVELDKQT